MDTPNSKKTLIALFVILVVVISFLAYFLVTKNKLSLKKQPIANTQKEIPKPVIDWAAQASALPKTVEAKTAFAAGDYEKAYLLFKEAASSTDDFNVRSTLEISAAGTFMNIDTKKGSEYFAEIVNNPMYTNLSRGFALLQIAQFYKGNRDIAILKPYFKDSPILKQPVADIEYKLYSDIYAFHPYGIAGANMARYELVKSPTEAKAKEAYEKYSAAIDKNIEEMKLFEGMKQLVPNTYIAKAALYRDLYVFKVVTKEQVTELYELADKEAKVQNNTITQQFNILRYADFLAEIGEMDKMNALIAGLSAGGVSQMVTRNLSTLPGSKIDYKNLAKVFGSSQPTDGIVVFFKRFKW